MNLNEFLVPNILFDELTTSSVRNVAIQNLSLTRGMVKQGQLIISKGDVVNDEKFRMLESLKIEFENYLGDSTSKYLILLGQIILVFMAILMLFLFLYNFRRDILQNTTKLTFIILMYTTTIFVAALAIKTNFINVYLVPFAVLPIIIRTFYDTRLALFVHLVTILLVGFLAPNGFEFVFLQFMAGVVAINSLRRLHSRSQLVSTAAFIILTYSFVYFGIAILQEGNLSKIEWISFAWFAGNGFFVLLSYPLIAIFEKVFKFLSDVTLVELSNTNTPLLKLLAEKAPGTYQHSLQVATLAEEMASHLIANPLLVKAGALYHDIGKIKNPQFFIENQISGINPHNELDFVRSAEIVIEHVNYGIEIAKKYNLPDDLCDFIRTHHGTNKVLYFYRMFINTFPGKQVDEAKFTYPGPKPMTKENAIVMIADSIEAASRSLKVYDEQSIAMMIDSIIDYLISEDQFGDTNLTFKDVNTIRRVAKKKLVNIYHTRIEYPK